MRYCDGPAICDFVVGNRLSSFLLAFFGDKLFTLFNTDKTLWSILNSFEKVEHK
jgi:hypothetical protein